MIGAMFILTSKGDLLLSRVYRDDVSRTVAEAFKQHVVLGTGSIKLPVNNMGSTSFMHIVAENMYFVAITTKNANSLLVFQFLHKFVDILKSYFGELTVDAVKNSFVLIYELMDEILDFGYPQTTDIESLKSFITTGNANPKLQSAEEVKKITIQATGVRSNRPEGIRYRDNVVYLEVLENVNMLMSAKGTLLRSDATGQIMVKNYLSGMPECKLILNDKLVVQNRDATQAPQRRRAEADVLFDDITFHPCVKLNKFGEDRSISFMPPDGEFELMKYRTSDGVQLPFRIIPTVKEISSTRLSINVTIKSTFKYNLLAENVVIKIPTPPHTAECRMTSGTGKAKYDAALNAIVWKIREFPGMAETKLSGEVELIASTSGKSAWSRPPISVEFVVPSFAASGLVIASLAVYEKSEYKVAKWARSITKSGTYQHRI